jgi:hypothetical protein
MNLDDRNVLLKTREIILAQIDFTERASNHKPMTNVILDDYAYENPETLLKPVKRLIEPDAGFDRRILLNGLSFIESVLQLKIKTSDVIKIYKNNIGYIDTV